MFPDFSNSTTVGTMVELKRANYQYLGSVQSELSSSSIYNFTAGVSWKGKGVLLILSNFSILFSATILFAVILLG